MAGEWYEASDVVRWGEERQKSTPDDRTWFERDRARVLHSSALRRLAGKTQVVGPFDDDFPRTRLTHSLETAQVGRGLARSLGADPDLVDAACLAHDIGHPPFGHNGEAALDAAARDCGGFEGNAQSLRELTRLEVKIVDVHGREAGLNLTRATLDASLKYPWPKRDDTPKFGVYADDMAIFAWVRDGAPAGRRCMEAQLMDWADDVAYSAHDLEDGVVAGLIDLGRLADSGARADLVASTADRYPAASQSALDEALDRLRRQPWWVAGPVPTPSALRAVRAMTSELIARLCVAAVAATRQAYGDRPLRRYHADLVVPAATVAECCLLKGVTARFVMDRRDAHVRQRRQREVIAELLALLLVRAPQALDSLLRPAWLAACDDAARLRVAVDQVARLTDASAGRRHAQLTGRPWPVAL
ncbi:MULTISPECIES: deoxyguanosinetriphosphate triphosphohydrolase [unclassified Frankia]|uniref:deoxyguanosinetriphosphate triphosphohydrolase n=1 Tax=unclassified Frankia TaxID=2632575 RepID=UPI002AD33F49|nr:MULTISPECIES: deoxyguanosinetriphosphate triphosphohydrolase [unclassified Frankia]